VLHFDEIEPRGQFHQPFDIKGKFGILRLSLSPTELSPTLPVNTNRKYAQLFKMNALHLMPFGSE